VLICRRRRNDIYTRAGIPRHHDLDDVDQHSHDDDTVDDNVTANPNDKPGTA
jgi:hypothetical protein